MGELFESGSFASFDRTDISKGIARILLSLTDRKLNRQTHVLVLLSVPDGQDDCRHMCSCFFLYQMVRMIDKGSYEMARKARHT
jgi:hypothetical protein